MTSRGLTNESYYVVQKVARFLGTNNIDNASRICHSPSTVALKQTIGVGASTCSYKDWIGTDLLIFFGSNTPNNQPVTTKYIYEAKKKLVDEKILKPEVMQKQIQSQASNDADNYDWRYFSAALLFK